MGRNGLARIKVIGVGGGGGNAVDRMKKAKVKDVELIAVNTDAQVLSIVEADRTVQIGAKLTAGLGAGGNPEVGPQGCRGVRGRTRRIARRYGYGLLDRGDGRGAQGRGPRR
jgi:cell division protein FtsZ